LDLDPLLLNCPFTAAVYSLSDQSTMVGFGSPSPQLSIHSSSLFALRSINHHPPRIITRPTTVAHLLAVANIVFQPDVPFTSVWNISGVRISTDADLQAIPVLFSLFVLSDGQAVPPEAAAPSGQTGPLLFGK